ncbi:MAG: TetR/AcrR family transcriptional regulator [Candidatus Hodarchaeota archaeon]
MPKLLDDEQIYRAVIQAVSQSGYTGTTTKQMADAAGISEVTLFRKYGNKQQLVKEAISFIIGQTDLKSASQYTGDVYTDLTRIVKAYYDLANKYGDFVSVMIYEIPRHLNLLALVDEISDIFVSIGKLIARYQNEDVLVKEPPLIALASLLSPIMIALNLKKVIPTHELTRELEKVDLSAHVTNFLAGRLNKML